LVQPDVKLGDKFRLLRRERALSLAEVAEGTQISSSFLSLFENGKSDITFSRLARLVRFFDVSITDLIPDPEPAEKVVVRREGRRRVDSPLEGSQLYLLTHDMRHKMMPVIGIMEPGGTCAETTITAGGELFVLVLKGEIEITADGEPAVQLRAGDAAYFSTERVHSFRNTGPHPAEVVAVQTPPTL
jgi:transcriptional regulator with XRE-family HTH domain